MVKETDRQQIGVFSPVVGEVYPNIDNKSNLRLHNDQKALNYIPTYGYNQFIFTPTYSYNHVIFGIFSIKSNLLGVCTLYKNKIILHRERLIHIYENNTP